MFYRALFSILFLTSSLYAEYRIFALNTEMCGYSIGRLGAVEDNTEIFKNDNYLTTINAGDFYDIQFNPGDYFSSNQPIIGVASNGNTDGTKIHFTPEAAKGTQFSIANDRRDYMEMGIYCVSDQDCNVYVEHPDGQQFDSGGHWRWTQYSAGR